MTGELDVITVRWCRLALALAALAAWTPTPALAHSAGQLDQRGCHDDRRRGEYHCHIGEYRGLKFSSKGDLLQQIKAGKTVADMRKEQGVEVKSESAGDDVDKDDGGGWLSHIPFFGDSDSDSHDVGGGEVIVPQGIEERLRVLKDLHEKGLISEEEYAAKRKEILGEL